MQKPQDKTGNSYTIAPPRILVLGAHPDDAEYHAGGLLARYRKEMDATIRIISLTDGAAGHHVRSPDELRELRQEESTNAGKVIGAEYLNWDLPDAQLEPTLENRMRVIGEIRSFRPDLVLTHRLCDYHPDHRAAAQLVQDASYLVTVPNVLPTVPPLFDDPVILYMTDLFTRPTPLRPDLILSVDEQLKEIIGMLACHRTQVFEWLPYEGGVMDDVPEDEAGKLDWLKAWFHDQVAGRSDFFRDALVAAYGEERGRTIRFCEAYEVSEYGSPMNGKKRRTLWPFQVQSESKKESNLRSKP